MTRDGTMVAVRLQALAVKGAIWNTRRRRETGETGLMAKAIDRTDAANPRKLDWRKRMSDNIAYALLVYTGLQIFVTVHALKAGSASLLPYLALVVLVAAIIPACRMFEARWMQISDEAAADPAFRPAYRRDQLLLWTLAVGLPFALTGLFKLIAATV